MQKETRKPVHLCQIRKKETEIFPYSIDFIRFFSALELIMLIHGYQVKSIKRFIKKI